MGETLMEERVRSLAEPVLARHGAELVDLQVKRGRTNLVRLTLDRDDGVDLETCALVSKELSRLLDADDPVPGRYTLEVTSPGADRPLRTPRDFRRNIGRTVRVLVAGAEAHATIRDVDENRVQLTMGESERWIPLDSIERAKLVLPW